MALGSTRRRVVLAILAFLAVGTAFAAGSLWLEVKAIRAHQAQSACQQNLSIGLGSAILSYRDWQGVYPRATTPSPGLPPHRRLSWLVEIFSSLGTSGISLEVSEDKPWNAPENLPLRIRVREKVSCCETKTSIGLSQGFSFSECPSRSGSRRPGVPGPASYAGIAGLGKDAAHYPSTDPRIGVFGYDRTVTVSDIRDGLSTTMMVAEAPLTGPWTAADSSTLRGLDPTRTPYIGKGRQFGGFHRGGVMTIHADGSVHFLRDTISPRAFEALATIARGD